LASDSGLDFDLDGMERTVAEVAGERQSVPERIGESSALDFDLDAGEGQRDEPAAPGGVESAASPPPLGDEDTAFDFDLGEDTEAGSQASDLAGADSAIDLDFDLGAGDEGTEDVPGEVADRTGDGGGTGLDLDFDLGAEVEPIAGAADERDGTGLDLDFDLGEVSSQADDGALGLGLDADLGGESVTPAADESEDTIEGTGLDLDFDIGGVDEQGTASLTPADEGMNLDLGEESPSALGDGDLGIELDLPTDRGISEENADDAGLDLGGVVPGEGSAIDLDLTLDAGEDESAGDAAKFDEVSDTVLQLQPDPESLLAGQEPDLTLDDGAGEGAAEASIDTQFRDIFDSGVATDEPDSAGVDLDLTLVAGDSASDLDLTLESDKAIEGEAVEGEAVEGSDAPAADSGGGPAPAATQPEEEGSEDLYETTQYMLRDVPPTESAPRSGGGDEGSELDLGRGISGEIDEFQTKLDLAQAYIDMDDAESARGVLGEVLAEGNAEQQEAAKGLLAKLP
jgi:pilus assembly protein FimV